jgi:hypothetical protein
VNDRANDSRHLPLWLPDRFASIRATAKWQISASEARNLPAVNRRPDGLEHQAAAVSERVGTLLGAAVAAPRWPLAVERDRHLVDSRHVRRRRGDIESIDHDDADHESGNRCSAEMPGHGHLPLPCYLGPSNTCRRLNSSFYVEPAALEFWAAGERIAATIARPRKGTGIKHFLASPS